MSKKSKAARRAKKNETGVSGNLNSTEACTHGGLTPFLYLNDRKCLIYAGGGREVSWAMDEVKPDLLISVGGQSTYDLAKPVPKVAFKGSAANLLPSSRGMAPGATHSPRGAMLMDWWDGSAPPVGAAFWGALFKDLCAFEGNVAIFCFGGHGRTGTALTIIAWLSGVTGNEDPVKWVRDHYCEEAVETDSQIKYLQGMGIPTTAEPSHSWGTNTTWKSSDWKKWEAKVGNEAVGGEASALEADLNSLRELMGEEGKTDRCSLCGNDGAPYNERETSYLCRDCERSVGVNVKPKSLKESEEYLLM